MKKEATPLIPQKKALKADPDMGQMLSEKDEVKKAEEKMRKSADKAKKS